MEQPWHRHYPDGVNPSLTNNASSMREVWDRTVARFAEQVCIYYRDHALTFAQIDAAAEALAYALEQGGVRMGDRFGLYLQNDPQWLVGLIAAWKAGVIPVAVNPMLKERELIHLLEDSGCTVLLCLDELYRDVVSGMLDHLQVRWLITTAVDDLIAKPGATEAAGGATDATGVSTTRLIDLLSAYSLPDRRSVVLRPDDIAVLTYTSGTTGTSKGAMNTHGGMAHSSQVFVSWFGINERDVVLGIAPLFHITGIVAGLGVTILSGAPLILGHRFDAGDALTAVERFRATFSVATITAYIAMATHPSVRRRDLSSLTKAGCGGAGISPAAAERIYRILGVKVLPVYGLTETTSPSHATPPEAEPPIDPTSGALAVGIPVPGAEVRIVDIESGRDVGPDRPGEVAIRGPMVVPGYWEQPEETAAAIRDGWLFTGDIGVEDTEGWLYIVDRKKDLIIAGGYKIWPREVEDVIYQHPAVREAAVVGVVDEYRGETVKAVVSLMPELLVTEEELIAFCRANMAAYKYPRIVEIRDEIPKTATGKILRRSLQ